MSFCLGMPTLIEIPDLDRTVELGQELGLSFIELNMNMPEYCPENLDAKKLKKITKDTGMHFALHSPDDLDIGSFHPSVRHGYLDRMLEAVHWSKEAGIDLINLHMSPGIYFTLPDHKVWIYDRYVDRFIDNLHASYLELLSVAERSGIEICTENVMNFDKSFIARAVDELCALDGFELTWDVGHDARTGYAEMPVLMRHEGRIKHMHLHDYDGKSDHQVPGKGKLDISDRLAFARSHDISVLIEVKTADALTTSIPIVRDILQR